MSEYNNFPDFPFTYWPFSFVMLIHWASQNFRDLGYIFHANISRWLWNGWCKVGYS